jgi:hypothetical protein
MMLEEGILTYAEVNNIAPAPIARRRKMGAFIGTPGLIILPNRER